MRIAVVGWGSLIWCNKALGLASKWHRDGPELPVEFARKSGDGRLTLVLVHGVPTQRTLWGLSAFEDLEKAREDLQKREGNAHTPIGSWTPNEPREGVIVGTVAAWCEAHGLDGAVWTALKPNWTKDTQPPTPEEAIDYLVRLKRTQDLKNVLKAAEEYLRLTPSQINTEIRKLARQQLGWEDTPLPSNLFEAQ